MAVANKHIENWTLNNIKFCGTKENWEKTYNHIQDDLKKKKTNLQTVKLGLLKDLTLA